MPASPHRTGRSPRAGAAAACLAALAALLGGCADHRAGGGSSAAPPRPTTTTTVPAPAPPGTGTPGGSSAGTSTGTASVTAGRVAAAQPPPARRPAPVNHCAHNAAEQLVLVSVRAQHAWFCAHARTVFDTPVTTGMSGPDTHTPLGRYHIQGRNRHTTLTLNTGQQYHVQYWVPFDAPLFGFHDSSWQDFPYGSPQYRTRGSHGCIHLPLAAMKHLYTWAHIGASVVIRR